MNTRNKKVLLADDDNDDTAIFEEALYSVDPTMVFFSSANGCEALQRLSERGFSPDVIFLDVNMPKMNGIECLQIIRQSPDHSTIPVIMYSTTTNRETHNKCLELGAFDFILKPSSYPEICEEIKKALNNLPDTLIG